MRYMRRSDLRTTTRSASSCGGTALVSAALGSVSARVVALPWPCGLPLANATGPAVPPEILDPRHHQLRTGLQVIETDVRVVLLKQPYRQIPEAMREFPQRVPGAHHMDLRARDPVRGEVRGLHLPMVVAPLRFELRMRAVREVQFQPVPDL